MERTTSRAHLATGSGEIPWRYTAGERRADGVVHALGILLALAGTAMFAMTRCDAEPHDLVASGIYLATLVFALGASAIYNMWPVGPTKWILRRIDHSAIYLLIAGTYTPFVVKAGTWWLPVLVWCTALLGLVLKVVLPGRLDRLSIALYLALGWSGVAILDRLVDVLSRQVLLLVGAGGVIYSLGVIFHVWERLRFQNAIWHGFVLAAAFVHYLAVWLAVGPST
ncbi:PAQR family membrane homeostasis protein TrhA [Aureimonas psammosilenae]